MASNKELKKYFPIAESITTLLFPLAEVVIHDLRSKKIAAIYNAYSKRVVGDYSLLEEGHDFNLGPDVLGPYLKSEAKEGSTKSITSVLRNKEGKAIGLLCINLDIKNLSLIHGFLNDFLHVYVTKNVTKGIFDEGSFPKINAFVQDFLKNRQVSPQAMTPKIRQEIVLALKKEGAFSAKNAAYFVASVLGISRASVYNYLAQGTEE